MNNSNPGTEETLRKELGSLGAREFEYVALTMDPDRGLAALRYATTKGVDYPIPYAIKLFDSPEWQPKGETRRVVTNASVDRQCERCGNDRFMPVADTVTALYGETYAPCAACNADVNASFYRGNGEFVKVVAR